jgi:hypothetical protein
VSVPPAFAAADVSIVVGWYEFELATVVGAVSETTGVEERTELVGRGRAGWWAGVGDDWRWGGRGAFAVATRGTWIRWRSNRRMLETPPLSTAAKPTLDPAAPCGARPGPDGLDTSAMTATATATARTAAPLARVRRATRRGWIAGTAASAAFAPGGTAGAWSALWTAAECSPQKSSALGGASKLSGAYWLCGAATGLCGADSLQGPPPELGGVLPRSAGGGPSEPAEGASTSVEAARGPNGTSSSRGPSQSRGRRTTLPRG